MTFMSLSTLTSEGPKINFVFTPILDKALAIATPCLPLDSLEI